MIFHLGVLLYYLTNTACKSIRFHPKLIRKIKKIIFLYFNNLRNTFLKNAVFSLRFLKKNRRKMV